MPKLMIPGPTEVSDKARAQMALPTRPHYGTQWSAFYFEVVDKLKQVFQTKNDLFVLAATSSAAMELSVSHAVEPGDKILICNNGFFGDRFEEMARHYGIVTVTTRSEYGQPIRGEQVREAIKNDPDIKALAIVHNESSTAVESPLEEIVSTAQGCGILTIVDCVSSMGGVDIPTDKIGIDYCISGSQKCFGSPAGLGFVSVSDKAWDAIASRKTPVPSWYLNLNILKQYQQQWTNWHPQGPNTAPVALYLALDQALSEIIDEGLANRFTRHTRVRDAFREAMRAMGLKLYVTDKWASRTLTAVCLPDGIDGANVRNNIESKHDILLAGGLGATANAVIRVGHLSMTATPEYIVPTIEALETELAAAGAKINQGVAVETFMRNYGA